MSKFWHNEAWEDYLYWQTQDKKTLKRIHLLLRQTSLTESILQIPTRLCRCKPAQPFVCITAYCAVLADSVAGV